ncbi:MAG: hypothetical protein ACKVOO_08165 [Burkholderiaceae bacterium]
MDKQQRERVRRLVKIDHEAYLLAIAGTSLFQSFKQRLGRVDIVLRDLLRKEPGSENSLKDIPTLVRYLFGLREDAVRLGFPIPLFHREIEVLNDMVIAALGQRRSTKYAGECASYGETLLNCYLDLFVTLTVDKTPRRLGAKPSFLVNPKTGANLELDVILEDFRLAFEFQGEHHYVDEKVIERDKFKLTECSQFQRILIPVNPYQLQAAVLQKLILNSIKDQLQIGPLFSSPKTFDPSSVSVSNKQLLQFSKAAQRIYLANMLFSRSMQWVDGYATSYVEKISSHSPFSTTTPAPRLTASGQDLEVEAIYRGLSLVTKLRRGTLSNEPPRVRVRGDQGKVVPPN